MHILHVKLKLKSKLKNNLTIYIIYNLKKLSEYLAIYFTAPISFRHMCLIHKNPWHSFLDD